MQNEIKVGDTVYLKEAHMVGNSEFKWVVPSDAPLLVKDTMIDSSLFVQFKDLEWWIFVSDVSTTLLSPIISDVQFEVGNG
jgi:hypothetical protein